MKKVIKIRGWSGSESHGETETKQSKGMLGRLIFLAVALLLSGQVVLAWLALNGFERELEPQLTQKAHTIGVAVADQFEFAVDHLGIPPKKLVGVDDFLDQILQRNSDIEYLVMLDANNEVLFARGLEADTMRHILPDLPGADATPGQRTEVGGFAGRRAEARGFLDGAFPIKAGGSVASVLHVGTSKAYVRGRLSEILYEVITVIVISWLVTLEFLIFFMNTRVNEPMDLLVGAMAEGTEGGFANRFALRAKDEIGQVGHGVNRMLRDIGKRYEDFRFEVREMRGAQIDDSIARRIQNVLDKLSEKYRFSGGATLYPQSAMQIRIPLFLFIFSEELSRSFLPIFVAKYSPVDAFVSSEFLIGFPITLFMLVVAAVTPIGGGLVDRFGARRVFLAGLGFAILGYIGIFFVQGYYDFLLWRALGGVGYGLLYIAAQVWVTERTVAERRAQGMAVFTGAIFTGAICGPPIGSIMADRIGYEATFLISAVICVIAAIIVYQVLTEGESTTAKRKSSLGRREWGILLTDSKFLAVTLLAAVPSKMVLTGFLFYLVPLYLSDLGNAPAAIGWAIMLYGVATVSCTSVFSRFADRTQNYPMMVLVGGMLPGIGCAMGLFQAGIGATLSVVVAVVALGIGHSMSLTSQLTIIQKLAEYYADKMGPASVVAAFRLVERGGLVLGPIVAGGLVVAFGYQGAMIGIGVTVLISISLYAAGWYLPKSVHDAPREVTA